MCVSGLALVALAQVNPEQATRLCAAAETGIESMRHWSIGRWVIQRAEYKRTIAAIRAQIEEPTFAAAWAEGQKLTLEQAIAEALAGSPINDGASLDAKESSM